jgi:hypothetical protein
MGESDDTKATPPPSDVKLPIVTTLIAHSADDGDSGGSASEADLLGGWRFESQRWLATLNPGRTQREYQKAISYFFATPGVPQRIAVHRSKTSGPVLLF